MAIIVSLRRVGINSFTDIRIDKLCLHRAKSTSHCYKTTHCVAIAGLQNSTYPHSTTEGIVQLDILRTTSSAYALDISGAGDVTYHKTGRFVPTDASSQSLSLKTKSCPKVSSEVGIFDERLVTEFFGIYTRCRVYIAIS